MGLRESLKWALEYIGYGFLSDDTPDHNCQYDAAPDEGYCEFCEKYWDAREALAELEKPVKEGEVVGLMTPERKTEVVAKIEVRLKDYCFDAWTFNNEQKQYMGEWDSDRAKEIITDVVEQFEKQVAAERLRTLEEVREKASRLIGLDGFVDELDRLIAETKEANA